MSYREALEALKRGEYEVVIKWYDGLPPEQRDGKACALAALAHFKREEYGAAAEEYANACQAGGSDSEHREWREMRNLSKANHAAKINIEVPKPHYFKDDDLLGPPVVRNGDLVCSTHRSALHCCCRCLKRLRLFLGEALGTLGTWVIDVATHVVGWKYDYRGRVWTNWDRRGWLSGVLTLAYIRELLNDHNLVSTYPPGELVAFQKRDLPHPPSVENFRTADGSWNSLSDPKEGAAGTRFLRNVDLSAAQPETRPRLDTPNARTISLELLRRPDDDKGQPKVEVVPFLNLLAASWIQFMIHDWVSHSDTQPGASIEVDLPAGDPAHDRYQQTKLTIGKTQADPTYRGGVKETAATSFINEVTHWWDGSQIYGSDQLTQDLLRSNDFGKMKLNDDGTLQVDSSTGVEKAGFLRNWWVGLSMLHTLFVREHNAICDMLHEAYPDWDDECLFNVARLINAALMAKIHSVEWTPAILPNQTLETGLNSNWYGLLTFLLHKGKKRKTVAEVNIRNPELGGIVGNPINKHDCVYGLSEEFVEVYRLHSLLPETLQLRRPGEDKADPVPLPKTRQHGSACLTQDCPDPSCPGFSAAGTKKYAMSDLFYSFGKQHPGAPMLNNFPRFMQELSVAGNTFLDMGAVDIVRARERGVPRYNEFRRQLGLNPIRSFDDLTDDPAVTKKLESVYGSGRKGVEDLDLLIGTLAETHRPKGFGFGETVFQIFILSASRRLQADRFYTDCYNEDVYTAEGLRWIDQTDLKTVILRHYPELADTGLANIKNAFEPWDDGLELKPEEHPLRAWDCDLKPNPWRGDAYRRG
ncbi:MAG: peroxidase family protein [Mycobacterium sp.]